MTDFEVVLKRGVLYDGTGASPLRGDLGIRGSRIAAIGAELEGHETIDCDGLCVAPGFIDTHTHSDLAVLADPAMADKIRQGVTLEVLGHNGVGVAPLRAGDVERRREQVAEFLGHADIDWSWRSVANYLDAVDQARPALDTAYLVPHGAVRESITGAGEGLVADHDIFRMKGLLARSLDEGAFGISLGMGSVPDQVIGHDELAELAAIAASRHVPCVVHLRTEGEQLLPALQEAFRLGQKSGAPVHISHLKIEGEENWSSLEAVIDAFATTRRAGVPLSADLYPYTEALSTRASMLPPAVTEGGPEATLARLSDPAQRPRLRALLLEPARGWESFWRQAPPERIRVWELPSGKDPSLVGRDLASVAAERGCHPLDLALDLLVQEKLAARFLASNQSEVVLERLVALPWVTICSDSSPAGRPHPRGFGAFPRMLARYVREKRLLSLEAAIRKMTGLPADVFGFSDHGYLLEGKRANVVVFDPLEIRDAATFDQPDRPPEGIVHVLIGGRAVIRDGVLTGERPGRVARRGRS